MCTEKIYSKKQETLVTSTNDQHQARIVRYCGWFSGNYIFCCYNSSSRDDLGSAKVILKTSLCSLAPHDHFLINKSKIILVISMTRLSFLLSRQTIIHIIFTFSFYFDTTSAHHVHNYNYCTCYKQWVSDTPIHFIGGDSSSQPL